MKHADHEAELSLIVHEAIRWQGDDELQRPAGALVVGAGGRSVHRIVIHHGRIAAGSFSCGEFDRCPYQRLGLEQHPCKNSLLNHGGRLR